MTPREIAEALWAEAQLHPWGIFFTVDETDRCLALLYEIRRERPELLEFRLSQQGNVISIIRCLNIPEIKTEGEFKPLEIK